MTPLEDHIKRAIERMQQGARMILDAIPNDSSLSSASFGPDVTAEIARRLSATPPAVTRDTPSQGETKGLPEQCRAEHKLAMRPITKGRLLLEAADKIEADAAAIATLRIDLIAANQYKLQAEVAAQDAIAERDAARAELKMKGYQSDD